MKKTKSREGAIAVFLIVLIVSLPVYSSIVFAYLSDGYITGETDKIKGYYRENEDLSIHINAKISGKEIAPSQIRLEDAGGEQFIDADCTKKDDLSLDCTHKISPGSTHYTNQFENKNPHRINVVLFSANGPMESISPVEGAFDVQPPEIKSFDITPQIVNKGSVTFKYEVYDHSYKAEDSNKCSGIKKIELSYGDTVFKAEEVNSASNRCKHSPLTPISIPIETITTQDGQIDVVLTAYDNFGQPSSMEKSFIYDRQAPAVEGALQIKNSAGKEIDYIKDEITNGKILFTIRADTQDLDLTSRKVYADISGANSEPPLDYLNKEAKCTFKAIKGIYECAISGVNVKLNKPAEGEANPIPVTIKVEAYDNAGNKAAADLTKNIYYDDVAPEVTAVKTDKESKDKEGRSIFYVGSKTTFTAELTENGVGINKEDVTLDLSSIQSGLKKAADKCESTTSGWKCYWNDVSIATITAAQIPDGKKTISVSGKDKLGNLISGKDSSGNLITAFSQEVILDRTSPRIRLNPEGKDDYKAEGTPTNTNVPALAGELKTTDKAVILINAAEANVFKEAFADFTSISTGESQKKVAATPVLDEKTKGWQFKFESGQIDVQGYINTEIPLTFIDIAGNKLEFKVPIIVSGFTDEKNPDYWTNTASCSPSLVDRQITPLTEYQAGCTAALTPTGEAETISISFDEGDCTEEIEGSKDYIKSIKLLNGERGSTEPFFNIELNKMKMPINEISLKCPLRIITKYKTITDGVTGWSITKNPETEKVTISIKLYNMPLGEFGKSVEKKIKDVKDEIAVGYEWVGSLKKILLYAENICKFIKTLHTISGTFGTLEQSSIPVLKEAASVISNLAEKASTGYTQTLYGYCKYISCDKTLWGNWSTGQQSLWLDKLREPGRGAAAGGDKEVGGYENWVRKYDLGTMFPENPKDSLVLSIATGCIPGIVYNIEKWRQIQCNYGVCLWDSKDYDILISACEEQKSYLTCKFLWGEIFQLLPINWARSIAERFMYILSDPLSLIFGLADYIYCNPSPPEVHGKCAVFKALTVLPEIYSDLAMMFDGESWKVQGDMCEVYFDRLDELEKVEESAEEGEV